jgi:hypothetical protein
MKYTVTIKPAEPKGELSFFQVDASKAKEIMTKWDTHQNVQIGDAYISWQRIVEVTAPPKDLQLSGPQWCGKCEKGWLGEAWGEWKPCSCNPTGKEKISEYRNYLETQDWYKQSQEADRAKSREEYLQSDPYFNNTV